MYVDTIFFCVRLLAISTLDVGIHSHTQTHARAPTQTHVPHIILQVEHMQPCGDGVDNDNTEAADADACDFLFIADNFSSV